MQLRPVTKGHRAVDGATPKYRIAMRMDRAMIIITEHCISMNGSSLTIIVHSKN